MRRPTLLVSSLAVSALLLPMGAAGAVDSDQTEVPAPTCLGIQVTILGTAGNDQLTGTPGPDVIDGQAGNDTIVGLDGADRICGGLGTDLVSYADHEAPVTADLTGGLGDDGSDEDGPEGARDSIAKDVEGVTGGYGNDVLTGNSSANAISGGPGEDQLSGGVGNDVVHGDSGDDLLRGQEGADEIWGDAGDDLVYGGGGADHLLGGAGGDYFSGGGDPDQVSYDDGQHSTGVNASLGGTPGGDGNRADGPAGERDTITNSVEDLNGSPYDDVLTGNAEDNAIAGDNGKDTMLGLAGTDYLFAVDGERDTKIDCGADADFGAARDAVDPSATSCTAAAS